MRVGLLVICAMLSASAFAGSVDTYPVRPIRMLASGVGGTGDFTARLLAPGLFARMGQQVIVDNRPGGVTPGEIVAKAQPDGYTLMMVGAVIWLSPFMRDGVPFDPVRDFAPVTLAVSSPNLLVAHPSVPVKTVRDLIALARQKPGALNYASSGIGNSNHLAAEFFKAMAGVDMVSINYRGASLALNDLLAGRVQLMFATVNAAGPHVTAGRLNALAVTSAQPSRLMPGVPTVAASGLPGFESAATLGVLARAGTPAAIVNRLHREIVEVLNTPENTERLFRSGTDVVGSTPAQFAAMIKDDILRKGKIIKSAHIRMD